jgi:hypothetical protein
MLDLTIAEAHKLVKTWRQLLIERGYPDAYAVLRLPAQDAMPSIHIGPSVDRCEIITVHTGARQRIEALIESFPDNSIEVLNSTLGI